MDKLEKSYKCCWWSLLMMIAFLFVLAVMALVSCTTTKIVEVERVRTDTTYITKWQKDSVWLHDSVFVNQWMKGETVYVEKAVWHTEWRDRLQVDTIYQATRDTIPKPYPVTEYVEKKLNWWQQFRLWLGNILLVVLLAFTGYGAYRLWKVYKFF